MIDQCRVMGMPRIQDPRGNLTFIEASRHVPFDFKRVYYLYDVPGGSERGGHAHRGLHQFIIAMSGSFDVVLDDGQFRQKFHLNRSYYGLYICPMIWRELDNFSSGSVSMVLASDFFDETDYIRDYDEFRRVAPLKGQVPRA
jgi:WxcM-like, C-terminal